MEPEAPLDLQTVVAYQGRTAVVTGRCKPVGADWKYDLSCDREIVRDIEPSQICALPGDEL